MPTNAVDFRELCFVYIIESPGDHDLLDGRTEGRSLRELLRIAEIPHEYNLVTTRATLDHALGPRLPAAMKKHRPGWRPIMHFSCHGNQDGLSLTDCSAPILWPELRQRLLPLNDSLRDAEIPLLVCISACFSAAARQMAQTQQSSPGFWGLVGHPGNAAWSDAAIGFGTFYHLLFKGHEPREAVEGMKAASGDDRFEFVSGETEQTRWLELMNRRARTLRELGLISNEPE